MPESLGKPDLTIADLKVWIHGRERPNSEDYWDGNWLRVTALCSSAGASIKVHGPIVHLSELQKLQSQIEELYKTLRGAAELACMEPNLSVGLQAKTGGRIEVLISITPDPLSQKHEFYSELDQTYLPAIARDCKRILKEYPL